MKNTKRLSPLFVLTGFNALLASTLSPAALVASTDELTATQISSTAESRDPSANDNRGQPPGPETSLQLDLSFVPELEITDSSASFDLAIAEITLELPWFSISASQRDFTWEGAENLPFSGGSAQPWEQLTTVELRKDFTRPIRDNLFLLSSVGVGLSFEEEVGDAYSANALAAVVWSKSADWSFLFGAGYSWHPEVELEFELFPAIGFSYRQNAERGFWGSLGIPQTGMGYRFSPRSAISFTVDADTFVTRLADDSDVAAAGYAEFVRFGVGLYYEHSLGERFRLKLGPNFGFEGELKIHDRSGVLLSTHDLESAPGFKLEMAIGF
ncbi:MAG: hypothetical protein AAF560_30990 [Acidobacteriota bacterium]